MKFLDEGSGNYKGQKAQSLPSENLQPRMEGELPTDNCDRRHRKAPEGHGTGLNAGLWGRWVKSFLTEGSK